MKSLHAAATVGLLLGSGACGLLVDSQGLTGETARDGGDAPDSSVANDATSTSDAGTDAVTASDVTIAETSTGETGPAKGFCAAHPGALFCEDFDGQPLAPERVVTNNGTGLASASPNAPSPPNVFVAQVAALSTGGNGYASFRPPDVSLTKFHVAFDVSHLGGPSAIVFDLIGVPAANTNSQSELMGDSTFALYQEFFQDVDGGTNTPFSFVSNPPSPTLTSAWHHFDVCFNFTNNTRVVAVDGVMWAQGKGVTNWPATGTLSFGSFTVGGPSTLQEVHIDNVLIDTGACP